MTINGTEINWFDAFFDARACAAAGQRPDIRANRHSEPACKLRDADPALPAVPHATDISDITVSLTGPRLTARGYKGWTVGTQVIPEDFGG